MSSLKYIFAKSEFIDGIGDIYPIKLKDYDTFQDCVEPLYYSKKHFNGNGDFYLLDAIIRFIPPEQNMVTKLERLFSLTLKKDVLFIFDETSYTFVIDNEHFISVHNYEKLREIIMKQNLIFEPKVYKDPLVQQWAMKALEAKSKNSVKMEIEDMVSTVATFSGKHYSDLAEYTIYQLKSEFNRISKIKGYDTNVAYRCVGAEVPIDYFAESIDMFKNPYDDAFKSKDKLNKLEGAFK
jgi:hypothetical protein